MMTMFAVQTVAPEAKSPEFVFVGAQDPQDAAAAAAQRCREAGQETTQVIAVFTAEDLAALTRQMDVAAQQLAQTQDR